MVWLMMGVGLGILLGFWQGLRFEKIRYSRMVDGDTFWVTSLRDGSEWRVRLWGVDAPDLKECYFEEATRVLEKELMTKSVTYERMGYDGYGRILAKVLVDGENVEDKLVATGAATVYTAFEVHDKLKPSPEYIQRLKGLETRAKEAKLGRWSEKCLGSK